MRSAQLASLVGAVLVLLASASCTGAGFDAARANVVLILADDLGWGDTGFHDHPLLQTPQLDHLASLGTRLDRFYAASPVCSPTRASMLTGRHPHRMGILGVKDALLKPEELTLAEILRDEGYATGHFGKWHLGSLTSRIPDGERSTPPDASRLGTPAMHGFDVYFSTEAKVPTFDPMVRPSSFDAARDESLRYGWDPVQNPADALPFGSHYWTRPDQPETAELEGDDSQIIMDRAIPFIESALEREQPFLAALWLHTPHSPVVAGPEGTSAYAASGPAEARYFAAVSAMDQQVGRLWKLLQDSGAAASTLLCFFSDNGPRRGGPGSTGPFRGRKGSLYEGGVRVPALCVWPGRVSANAVRALPASSNDYLPTVLAMLGIELPDERPLDGVSLADALAGQEQSRRDPIGFWHRGMSAWTDDRYKLISVDQGQTFALYDLLSDPAEQRDLAASDPARVERMKRALEAWQAACERSSRGTDY